MPENFYPEKNLPYLDAALRLSLSNSIAPLNATAWQPLATKYKYKEPLTMKFLSSTLPTPSTVICF